MTAPVAVDVVRVRPGGDALPLPRYMTPDAAGMDLRADLEAEIVLAPGERRLVPTGLAVAIPPGFEGQVRARSGLAARDGLTVLNAPGTIDADYRGEVQQLPASERGDGGFGCTGQGGVGRSGERLRHEPRGGSGGPSEKRSPRSGRASHGAPRVKC